MIKNIWKRLLVWSALILWALSFNITSADDFSCNLIYDEIKNYPVYKSKVDNLFTKILKKDDESIKKYYLKLDKITKDYIRKIEKNDNKKLYSILTYINCENEYKLLWDIINKAYNLVYEYYNNISYVKIYTNRELKEYKIKNDLEKAYYLKYMPKISLEEFKSIYESDIEVSYNIKNLKYNTNNTFSFSVDIKEDFKISQRYITIMKIINWKLQTISTKNVNKEIKKSIAHWNDKAILEWNWWDYNIILNDKIIYTVENKEQEDNIEASLFTLVADDIDFTDNWEVLIISIWWYEFLDKKYYSLKKKKIFSEWASTISEFSQNSKYFFQCDLWWYSNNAFIKIFDWKTLKEIKKINTTYENWNIMDIIDICYYDEKNNILLFKKEKNNKIDFNKIIY